MKRLHCLFALLPLGALCILAGCQKEIRYQPPPPITGENITDLKDSWVEFYSEPGFRGLTLTIKYPKVEPNFGAVRSDDGKDDFAGKARSVKWQLPLGWQAEVHGDADYKGDTFPLVGTGKVESNSDLGRFAGEARSMRWERKP